MCKERSGGIFTKVPGITELLVGIPSKKLGKFLRSSSSTGGQAYSLRKRHRLLQRKQWVTVKQTLMCCKLHLCKHANSVSAQWGVWPLSTASPLLEVDSSFSARTHYCHTSALSTGWVTSGWKEYGLAHSRYFATSALWDRDMVLQELLWQKISIGRNERL